mmetsp:Transcript_13462/g.38224  ORF Transcript_13462/g.38224 Transcript_13462/m.38224 type:complete len:137 (-) Transcript_13462:169-579(-)
MKKASPSQAPASPSDDQLLYEDGFVRIDRRALHLRNYYFPLCTSKRIAADDIASVKEAAALGVDGWLETKVWGMALNNIWWALDWARYKSLFGIQGGNTSFVVECKRSKMFRHAFSVKDVAAARRALDKLVTGKGD